MLTVLDALARSGLLGTTLVWTIVALLALNAILAVGRAIALYSRPTTPAAWRDQ